MAGGTWQSQNKIRPGAYFNFKSVPRPAMTVGDRGIGIMAIPLTWGAADTLIDVYSTDMLDGASLAKVGVTAFDEATEQSAKLLNLMLSGCYMAKIYRINAGGEKATVTLGDLTVTAKYTGTFGNSIVIAVVANNGHFDVTTYAAGGVRHTQTVNNISGLAGNDFVDFSGEGSLTANAGAPLTGGTDGSHNAAAYSAYFTLASRARWQTMAVVTEESAVNTQAAAFAKTMRNDEGRYVQIALANYTGADFYGLINADCGFARAEDTVTAVEATAWVAGLTAGASIVQSNTGRVVPGAVKILHERTNTEIIEALKSGMFILSSNQRGEIIVEDDINSQRTFTPELSEDFRLNQIVRVLDEIGTNTQDVWEQSFKGKVLNNEDGRMIFKSALLSYLSELQSLGAITEFVGADDVTVEAGTAKDAIIVTIAARPVAAMTKLYATVFIN